MFAVFSGSMSDENSLWARDSIERFANLLYVIILATTSRTGNSRQDSSDMPCIVLKCLCSQAQYARLVFSMSEADLLCAVECHSETGPRDR